MAKTLFFDTETNGLGQFRPTPTHRIVQMSWITYDNEEKNYFISDGARNISYRVPHDITIPFLKEHGVPFDAVFREWMRDIQEMGSSGVVVAHNVSYDMGCLLNELNVRHYPKETLEFVKSLKTLCTMKTSTGFCKLPSAYSEYKWPKMEELYMKLHNGEKPDAKLHDSLEDCRVLREIFLKGKSQIPKWKL